jgi:hypothetical protein
MSRPTHRLSPLARATGPIAGLLCSGFILGGQLPAAIALPPPEDVPEEILRTEIILEARDRSGQPMAAGAYAQLQQAIDRRNQDSPQVAEELQSLLLQLRLLSVIKSVVPFLP